MADEPKDPPPVAGGAAAPPPKPLERAHDSDVVDALTDLSVDVTHIGHYLTHAGARQILLQLKARGLTLWYNG